MGDLQFGVNVRSVDPDLGLRSFVERVDDLGFDILALPDHLGAPSPFASLAAAAQFSDPLPLRTYVLNVGFWNPALLARVGSRVAVGGRDGDVVNDRRVDPFAHGSLGAPLLLWDEMAPANPDSG